MSRTVFFCAGGFGKLDGAIDGGGGAGDDDLLGSIEIGGGDDGAGNGGAGGVGLGGGGVGGGRGGEVVGGFGAEVVDLLGGEAEDGGHGAFAGGNGLLHEAAAGADGGEGFGKGEGAGGDVGAVLAEGMAGGEAGFEGGEELGEDALDGDGNGKDGGLGVFGLLEGLGGAFEDEVREMEAEGFVGFFEDGFGGGEVLVEIETHAYGLGALAGEEEGGFDWRVHRGIDGK